MERGVLIVELHRRRLGWCPAFFAARRHLCELRRLEAFSTHDVAIASEDPASTAVELVLLANATNRVERTLASAALLYEESECRVTLTFGFSESTDT